MSSRVLNSGYALPGALSPIGKSTATAPVWSGRATLGVFVFTLFLSSSLLALIEPMFAKMVLPLLGGTPAVWNTCLVFFQAVLLAGYAYGHWSLKWLGPRKQAMLHVAVLLFPIVVLPIAIPHGWSPPVNVNPLGWLLALLVVAIGLPYFAVSSSAPIIQRWFSSTSHRWAADPYFLYAASNLGSMLGLLAYPVLVEPFLKVGDQCLLWTFGYITLVALTITCMFRGGYEDHVPTTIAASISAPISIPRRLRWILLAFIPSSQLLGVTTFMTSDIAAVPLLWILPLSLYFLSFILVFSRRPIVSHRRMVRLLPAVMVSLALFMMSHAAQPVGLVLSIHLLAMFVSAMVCHGELAKDRPPADRLTDFYLMLSVGGVCGGLFNALLAPLIFNSAIEYPIAIVLACLICPSRRLLPPLRSRWARAADWWQPIVVGLLAWSLPAALVFLGADIIGLKITALGIPVLLAYSSISRPRRFAGAMAAMLIVATCQIGHGQLLTIHRSFFGIHRVLRASNGSFNELYHGTTIHGKQHIDPVSQLPTRSDEALTYYYRTGPIGQLLGDKSLLPSSKRISVVGLGVGSLAVYADSRTLLTYYEIDPAVIWVARDSGYFTFLRDAKRRGADTIFISGDARLTLANAPDHRSDLIVLDAFSGDAVPVHLLTRQAMAIYQAKLADHGLLAIHASNMYLDLRRVVAALAEDGGWQGLFQDDLDLTEKQATDGKLASQWLVLARSDADLAHIRSDKRWHRLPPADSRVWTDDYSNILSVLRSRCGR
jgi:hypothetical protein